MLAPNPGRAYYFSFVDGFAVFNGTYYLGQVMSFAEAIEANVDLLTICFTPAGYDESKYLTDLESIKSSLIMKLSDPDNNSDVDDLYIPVLYCDELPNINVKKYYKLALGVNLGILDDKYTLEATRDVMQEQLSAAFGFTEEATIFEITSTWLSKEEYDAIDAARQTTAKHVINHYSTNQELQKEIIRLKSAVAGYQKILSALHDKNII